MNGKLKREDLIYPELSYKIVGALFEVFNELGYQYQEKYYQRGIGKMFSDLSISFIEQVSEPINFRGKIIGRYIYDFVVDNKIILEIKRGDRFSIQDIRQVPGYLKRSGLKLAILARFSSKGLKYKRIVNL